MLQRKRRHPSPSPSPRRHCQMRQEKTLIQQPLATAVEVQRPKKAAMATSLASAGKRLPEKKAAPKSEKFQKIHVTKSPLMNLHLARRGQVPMGSSETVATMVGSPGKALTVLILIGKTSSMEMDRTSGRQTKMDYSLKTHIKVFVVAFTADSPNLRDEVPTANSQVSRMDQDPQTNPSSSSSSKSSRSRKNRDMAFLEMPMKHCRADLKALHKNKTKRTEAAPLVAYLDWGTASPNTSSRTAFAYQEVCHQG
mmetsp:Transcript_19661/g.42557  ORF Transcript_19661/g.42557 Transcript_19661/m.42557 type:complete len:253 (+) Transcript_19661:666-1424(+)